MTAIAQALVTCLVVFRTPRYPTAGVSHHCTRQLPHTTHRCPCGIEWR